MPRQLTPEQVGLILDDLVTELTALASETSVYVIGGAAIALLDPARRSTTDVDGWIGAAVDAMPAVERVRRRWGLDADWFNANARMFAPSVVSADEVFVPIRTSGAVTLYAARPDALLAMKLVAARRIDQDDIAFLLAHCDVRSVEQADDLLDRYYPGDSLSDIAVARVEAALSEARFR